MLTAIIKKEILEAILSFRFLIATLLCIFLVPLGLYINLKEYEKRMTDYQESVRLYMERSEGNIESEFPAEGYRPPSVLSIFSVGLENYLPNKIVTSRDGNIHISNEQGINNPQSLLFGKVDLLFNVSYVISLLALIFSFNTITGEKEDGTLRLMMSNPVLRRKVLIAKIIGNYLVLLIPFFVSILISLIILGAIGIIPVFSTNVFSPFLIISVITLLFIMSMFNLGVLVSTLTHRTLTSITALLFIWAIIILSIPKVSPMIAGVIYPIKSQQVINTQKSMVREILRKELDDKSDEIYSELAPKYGIRPTYHFNRGRTDNENQFLVVYDSLKSILDKEYEGRISSEINKIEKEYYNQQKTQTSFAMNLSRLSPASCYAYIISEISATGTIEAYKVRENASRFQSQVKEDIYDKFIIKKYGGSHGSATTLRYADGFDVSKVSIPQLNYQHTTITEALEAEWIDIVLLCLFNLILFAVCNMTFQRYDVR
jgi:ABC-type transport system involved in multi-copper enzyme maturation permease subunit